MCVKYKQHKADIHLHNFLHFHLTPSQYAASANGQVHADWTSVLLAH